MANWIDRFALLAVAGNAIYHNKGYLQSKATNEKPSKSPPFTDDLDLKLPMNYFSNMELKLKEIKSYCQRKSAQTLDNGLEYKGDFTKTKKSVNPNGKGMVLSRNEAVQLGIFKDGFLEGPGMLVTQDEIRAGNFQKGELSGIGQRTFDSGKIMVGEFANNEINGKGKILFPDETICVVDKHKNDENFDAVCFHQHKKTIYYKGTFDGDDAHGSGIWFFPNGDHYEGGFLHGIKEGEGTLYNQYNDIIYKGNFVMNAFGNKFYYHRENLTYILIGVLNLIAHRITKKKI